jgi:hypothetical protein
MAAAFPQDNRRLATKPSISVQSIFFIFFAELIAISSFPIVSSGEPSPGVQPETWQM